MRYEVRFYDAHNRVKITVELDAPDRHGAERAAVAYLDTSYPRHVSAQALSLGVVREVAR